MYFHACKAPPLRACPVKGIIDVDLNKTCLRARSVEWCERVELTGVEGRAGSHKGALPAIASRL